MSAPAPTPGLKPATLAAFVAPCLPLAAVGLPLVVQLPAFYARHVGLPLATVGLVFMLIRLADIALDPFLGGLMDRTRTRFGRFRPWMIAGAPPLMLATGMLFWARPGAGPGYLALWLIVIAAGFSICTLAQTAWAARLSRDYDQRSRIYGWWQGANMVGMLLILLLPAVIGMRVKDDGAAGVAAMGWAIIVMIPLAIGLAVWKAPEPPPEPGEPVSWRQAPALLRRPVVVRLLLADLALGMAPGVNGALFLFFFRQAKGYAEGPANVMLLTYFVFGLLGAPLWSRLAEKTDKHRALALAAVYTAVLQAAVLFLPPLPLLLILPGVAAAGLTYCAAPILLRSMVADAADELRAETGREGAGLLYSLFVSTGKVGYALSVGLAFQALAWVGFQAAEGAANTPGALMGLTLVYIFGVSGFSLLGAALVWRYPLGRVRHAAILQSLAQLDRP